VSPVHAYRSGGDITASSRTLIDGDITTARQK
jgi:hypothetical protein